MQTLRTVSSQVSENKWILILTINEWETIFVPSSNYEN